MRSLALTFVALVGTVAANNYEACANTYQQCVTENPMGYQACLDTYYKCIGYASLVEKPKALQGDPQCMNLCSYNYYDCIWAGRDSSGCVTDYTSCCDQCGQLFLAKVNNAKPKALAAKPKSMKTYTECTNDYATCVSDDPYNWESCVETYN